MSKMNKEPILSDLRDRLAEAEYEADFYRKLLDMCENLPEKRSCESCKYHTPPSYCSKGKADICPISAFKWWQPTEEEGKELDYGNLTVNCPDYSPPKQPTAKAECPDCKVKVGMVNINCPTCKGYGTTEVGGHRE